MVYDPTRALQLLRVGSGRGDATFRDGQEEAIRHIVESRGRLLVVQKTGWGKSFVYFIAIKLLREAGLIRAERDGNQVHYQAEDDVVRRYVDEAVEDMVGTLYPGAAAPALRPVTA